MFVITKTCEMLTRTFVPNLYTNTDGVQLTRYRSGGWGFLLPRYDVEGTTNLPKERLARMTQEEFLNLA